MPDLNDVLKPHRDAAEERYQLHVTIWHRDGTESPGIDPHKDRQAFIAGARHALTELIILRTPEELDALPVGAKVLDAEGRVWTRLAGSGAVGSVMWRGPDHTRCGDLDAHEYLLRPGPVELIRLPDETEGEA